MDEVPAGDRRNQTGAEFFLCLYGDGWFCSSGLFGVGHWFALSRALSSGTYLTTKRGAVRCLERNSGKIFDLRLVELVLEIVREN